MAISPSSILTQESVGALTLKPTRIRVTNLVSISIPKTKIRVRPEVNNVSVLNHVVMGRALVDNTSVEIKS